MFVLSVLTGALLASVLPSAVQAQSQVTSDSFFFGQSPPVYPSPNITGLGAWAPAYDSARAFVSQLTREEKVNLTGGIVNTTNGCEGNIPGIPRLGFPGYCLADAGNGV